MAPLNLARIRAACTCWVLIHCASMAPVHVLADVETNALFSDNMVNSNVRTNGSPRQHILPPHPYRAPILSVPYALRPAASTPPAVVSPGMTRDADAPFFRLRRCARVGVGVCVCVPINCIYIDCAFAAAQVLQTSAEAPLSKPTTLCVPKRTVPSAPTTRALVPRRVMSCRGQWGVVWVWWWSTVPHRVSCVLPWLVVCGVGVWGAPPCPAAAGNTQGARGDRKEARGGNGC